MDFNDVYAPRVEAVVGEMARQSVDCLVISSSENIYYLTNYQTVGNPTQVLLLFRDKHLHLITRELEASNAKYRSSVSYSHYLESDDRYQKIVDYIANKDHTIKTIGFEYTSYRLSFKEQATLEKYILKRNSNTIQKDFSGVVARIRSIKSDLELSYIQKAADMVAAGITAGVLAAKPRVMETYIAGVINNAMMSRGCEYTAYPCFVASGGCGCIGHYTPEQKLLEHKELLFMEIGGCYKRYHAAKMHTIYLGSNPPDWFMCARELIQKAIRTVRPIMKPGVLAGELDAHMRSVLEEYPFDFTPVERQGYSIGIGFYTDWAEPDVFKIYPGSPDILYENMAVHLIPWFQIPGIGGIGFSDTVWVTKDGAVSFFRDAVIPEGYERAVNYINKTPSINTCVVPASRLHQDIEEEKSNVLTFIEDQLPSVLEYHLKTKTTPLICRKDIGGIGELYIKDESTRMSQKAFKVLGVSYAIHQLKEAGEIKPSTGVVLTTMTDGNHGSALAYLAKEKGYHAVIFVPRNMSNERIATIEGYGAKCIVCEGGYDDSIQRVRREAADNNWVLISDTSWEGYYQIPKWIVSGYCALFEEACQQAPHPITHIFLQVGVGGLAAAGIAYALLHIRPIPKLICVEPTDADCVFENVRVNSQHGREMTQGRVDSIMTGLNCGQPSEIAWPLLRDYISTYIAIGDQWARKAVRNLYHNEQRIYAGESGAAGFAGLLAALATPEIKEHLGLDESSNVLVVNTEGVTDKASFKKIINKNYL